jgi:phosphate transport system permease protein
MSYKQAEEKIFLVMSALATAFAVSMLFYIVMTIALQALPSLTWYFLTTPESKTPGIGQGILNAVAGTVIISIFATVIATPFAMGTAIYLSRYARKSGLINGFRFLLEVLSGTPSIVLGIFALLVFVYYLKPFSGGYSLIAGSVALAILILPVIERSVETSINAIDKELEEQSYALGATKWQTIRYVTVPCAMAGIITGVILGFGRAAEESAVVILTAGYSQYMPTLGIKANDNFFFGFKVYPFNDLVGTLPYSVYHAYENQSVIPLSNGFAAAFILIAFVLCVNIMAKIILSCSFNGNIRSHNHRKSFSHLFGSFKQIIPDGRNSRKESEGENIAEESKPSSIDNPVPLLTKITKSTEFFNGSPVQKETEKSLEINTNSTRSERIKTIPEIFLRTLLPFAIPAALLLILAFLATIPPLHHTLGPASPSLAGLFGTSLALIITVAGLIFGLLLAKKGGAFRGKTRRVGYAGVATGFCLICIAGLICSSAAAGIFSTGADPAPTASEDRNARLAALLASGEPGSNQPDGSEIQVQAQPAVAPTSPAALQENSTTGSIPRKNALSVGESYWYGDTQHTCRATVYDYKVLPFYFWWWIDYNRFVPQIPPAGQSYLVIFVRIENVGTQSAVIPSADRFNVSYHGYSSGRLPYLNTSMISTWQSSQLGTENRREQYYQWIREIGQDKRDYAYLTGENLFKGNSTTWGNVTTDITTSTTTSTTNITAYNGAFLKPGRSQAVDGYLIFPVPDAATKDLNNTYVDVAFNSLSMARWKLG